MKVIVNADDFGLSNGVNKAIEEGVKRGSINSTSLMIRGDYVKEAIDIFKNLSSELSIGLHFTLTNGKSCSLASDIPLLVDKNGYFKNGFLKLLLLSYCHPIKFKQQVSMELYAQLNTIKSFNIPISHIDGHRHIQMIPAIFKLLEIAQKTHQIPRIRIINDRLIDTIRSRGDFKFLFDGGIIKWLVLKILYLWNHKISDTYFYSILHTGRLFGKNISSIRIPKKYQQVEVMIHPARIELDSAPYPYPNPEDRLLELKDSSIIKFMD